MLREIFEENPNIIINNDIDGLLSGMILQRYYGCHIVGFSNSKDKVWVTPEVESIYDPVYIDMYVNRPDVICIDQHIVADTPERLDRILAYGTKLNPNLQMSRRTLDDFVNKYPFGTVHYLIALMWDEGVDVELGDLDREVCIEINGCEYTTNPGQVLLRADDALYNTLVAYTENSMNWWRILNNGASIQRIVDYIDICTPQRAVEYENNIGKIFLKLGCRRNNNNRKAENGVNDDSDGAFEEITDNAIPGEITMINERILQYIQKIGVIMGMELQLPDRYILHTAEFKDVTVPEGNIDADDLFSYAFVSGPWRRESCFSYTRRMED